MASISDILQSGSLAYTQPSPASVAARRALAKQLMESTQVQNAGPFGALANTLGSFGASYSNAMAGQEERAGQEAASKALAEALKGGGTMESLSGALSNPFMNSGQSGLINALIGREISQSDPLYQMQLKQAGLDYQQDLDAQPDPTSTIEGRSMLADQMGLQGDQRTAWILTGDLPSGGSLPTSFQEWQLAQSNPDYAASLNSTTSKPPTGDQANAGGFADRMRNAETVLQQTEGIQTDLGEQAKSMTPGVGNFLISPEYQQAMQAQRDFVNAVLRKESGAAISDQEFENARKQYFPQPGDSPQVIQQKRQNRTIAIQAMERSAGPGYEPINLPAMAAGNGVDDLVTKYLGQ